MWAARRTRRIKRALAKRGIAAGRRRIGRVMGARGLASCHSKAKSRPRPDRPNEADLSDVLGREFDSRAPHAHVVGDLIYVRVLGAKRDSGLVEAAFAAAVFPLFYIDVSHSDRSSEFDNVALDEMFEAFGITRPPSKKGCPYDNAVDESTNKTLKVEFVYQEQFASLIDLQAKLNDCVWRHDNERMHSKLGYMSQVQFRKAGLSL